MVGIRGRRGTRGIRGGGIRGIRGIRGGWKLTTGAERDADLLPPALLAF